jgi:DNA mismatch repair protein MutS2
VDHTTLEALEFPAILRELSKLTSTPIAEELALTITPFESIGDVRESYACLRECVSLYVESGALPLSGINDIRTVLYSPLAEGDYIDSESFVDVRDTLEALKALSSIRTRSFAGKYPKIDKLISGISSQDELLSELNRIFDKKGLIRDNASEGLLRVRKEMLTSRNRCRDVLESILRDSSFDDALQDDSLTVRDDRFVLSVRAGMQGKLPGVLHGRSKSGATFFIEPMAVLEFNNRIAILKKEEKAEEVKILRELSIVLKAESEVIATDLSIASGLDLLQAKVRLKELYAGTLPLVRECGHAGDGGGSIKLCNARHPLLLEKERKMELKVIPIDISMREETRVLVISGANAGGKTVALKTLGLFSLMARSALPISADEGSELLFFSKIFADIGDRQNISEDLSTFSAHLKRSSDILKSAGASTLVLIDEIGVGTDPSEGGVLALTILEALRDKGARIVVTTHLNIIKAHAATVDTFENASVAFDEDALSPLYRLCYGLPGASLGLKVAHNYGIPDDIIERARARLTGKEGAFVESLKVIEQEKEDLREELKSIKMVTLRREKALARLRDDREVLLAGARKKLHELIAKAETRLRDMLEEVKVKGFSKKGALKSFGAEAETLTEFFKKEVRLYSPVLGEVVRVKGTQTRGEVLAVNVEKKTAEISAGSVKLWVAWNKLEKSSGKLPSSRSYSSKGSNTYASSAVMSVKIIGMRLPEAMEKITRALDDAHVEGSQSLEIIHGVGAGILKKAVEEFLNDSPIVEGFSSGDMLHGGGGVTIARLK